MSLGLYVDGTNWETTLYLHKPLIHYYLGYGDLASHGNPRATHSQMSLAAAVTTSAAASSPALHAHAQEAVTSTIHTCAQ